VRPNIGSINDRILSLMIHNVMKRKFFLTQRYAILQETEEIWQILNPLTPNDQYRGRTAPLSSKFCILYIYSTNIGTEYFKHGINSQFFFLKNAVCFVIITYLFTVLFKFYVQGVLKLKKNSGAKGLIDPYVRILRFYENIRRNNFLWAHHFERKCVSNPTV